MLEPFGHRSDWMHTAQICATIANTTRTKTSSPVFRAKDFMPQEPKLEPEAQPWQSMMAMLSAVARKPGDKGAVRRGDMPSSGARKEQAAAAREELRKQREKQ